MSSSSAEHTVTPETPFNKWKSGNDYKHSLKTNLEPKKDSWDDAAEAIKNFDENLCKRWGDDIDALLTYAGLFSGIVATFAVESTSSLQQDPQEESIRLLTAIANQATVEPQEAFKPTTTAVTISVMYFLSLTLSLTSSLLSIICKQWIREYQGEYPPHLKPRQRVAVRQSRYEGLQKWHVPGIIAMIPLLLQAATALFFFGLVTMLWETNRTVAIVIMVPVIVSLLCVVVTTILAPIFLFITHLCKRSSFWQCPYKTPLGWNIIRLALWLVRLMRHCRCSFERPFVKNAISLQHVIRALHWSIYDLEFESEKRYEDCMTRAMTWMYPFQSSGQFSECLKDVKSELAWKALKKLIPFLKVAKGQKEKSSSSDDIEKPLPKEVLSSDDLEEFVGFAAPPQDTNDKKKGVALPKDDWKEDVDKDVIEVACILFRRSAPKNVKICFCLEACVRIINTADEFKTDLPPHTRDVVKYLVDAYSDRDLPKDIGLQLEAALGSNNFSKEDDQHQAMVRDIKNRLHVICPAIARNEP
ncbi:hypothetical protein VNI00_004340 [Paramarasmius palmivorus]|uniref:DUF6535 domain-containing protein n=1 Tax=Paramarasmius palmivorus TaxID=297713 RepID=A0AAW0DP47_9AGAR